MSDLTENWFYLSAELIWLCIRFAKWTRNRRTEDSDFGKKKIFQKIVAFEAQKTRTYTLRSRRTQNKSLFGADFGPEA